MSHVAMNCIHCTEPILPGERRHPEDPVHVECIARMVLGSVAHQKRECSCYGGTGEDDPLLSKRENARLAFEHGRDVFKIREVAKRN